MKEIETLRQLIDEIDQELIILFAKRLRVAKEIGKIKKEKKLPILDREREKQLLHQIRTLSLSQGVKPEMMEKIFGLYIDYTREEMQ
jgi:chorismate mutase-like protein